MSRLSEIDQTIIRYSNCWEDADRLVEALSIDSHDHVLSIGSAGDNSFSLLSQGPKSLTAIDLSLSQIYLMELKQFVFYALSYDEALSFLGFNPGTNRWKQYEHIKHYLTPNGQQFWKERKHFIEQGVIHCGKLEKYFYRFRKTILPLVHGKKKKDLLVTTKSETEQQAFFTKKWDTCRWSFLLRLFFSKRLMTFFGREPAFLNEVNQSVAQFIYKKTSEHLSTTCCHDNYFFHYILFGNFTKTLPHYIREENFNTIRDNLTKMSLLHQPFNQEVLATKKFNKLNCSNIFEYMNVFEFTITSRMLIDTLPYNARLAYWNLLVPRKLFQVSSKHFKQTTNCNFKTCDFGFFYEDFYVNTLK